MAGSHFSLAKSVMKDCQPSISCISSSPLPLVIEGKDVRKAALDSNWNCLNQATLEQVMCSQDNNTRGEGLFKGLNPMITLGCILDY